MKWENRRDEEKGNEFIQEGEEDYSDTLRRLEKKFGIVKEEDEGEEGNGSIRGSIDDEPPPTPSSDPIVSATRRLIHSSNLQSEKATARKFVTCLSQRIQDWEKLR